MGSRYHTSHLSPSLATFGVAVTLAALSACSLTKKEDATSTTAEVTAQVGMPAAPVFKVNAPQGQIPAGAAAAAEAAAAAAASIALAAGPTAAANKAPTTKGKMVNEGSGGGAQKASTASKGGGPAVTTVAAHAATGGTPATAATTTAAAVAAIPQVDMACLNGCAAKLQACVTAAGVDPAKLTACQSVPTTCQAECKK